MTKFEKMKRLLWALLPSMLLLSCANPSTEPKSGISAVDSLLEEVIAGHDVAMPKIKKLENLQKTVQGALDSLNKLPAAAKAASAKYKESLTEAKQKLGEATASMEKWMNEFGYDSLKDNVAERVNYLKSELDKVTKMKDAVLGSIGKADSLLGKKGGPNP